ncbi:DUF6316 family protein [Aliikangiella sp. G2MR2-5]|uniref:DUF6316 family protein n=1 Tax=Aliikangiella sp. G2MR2-5 TaxID=2788943 RepID=UPI0018AAB9B5|nr:DUF6316 family protein [Aliikangiella sp. G2MR2-5]
MSFSPRSTDKQSQEFSRSGRIVRSKGEFFYRTREQKYVGPFATKTEAMFDINVFIEAKKIEMEIQNEFFGDVA